MSIRIHVLQLALVLCVGGSILSQPICAMTGRDALEQADQSFEAEDWTNALKLYDDALRMNPQLKIAHYNKGLAYDQLGKPELAIKEFTLALKLDPKDAPVYVNRGMDSAKLKQFSKAIQDFNSAISFDNKQPEAFFNRALAHSECHNYDLALRDFTSAINLNPNHAEPYQRRAETHLRLAERDRIKARELGWTE